MKKVDLVVPCLNEASCVIPLYEAVEEAFREEEGYTFRILYVNDGSTDGTLEELRQLNREHPEHADYISFSRNFGKESAIYAGLEQSDGDLVVLMEGHDCVGARRISRHGEPPVRSFFSKMFYRIVKRLTGMEMVQGGSDFRMMTRQMVDAVLQLQERERFTKGILTWVGFDTKWIEYENVERFAGKSKWSFFDLLHYAVNGFVAFAAAPLKAVTWIGGIITAGAFIYGLVTLIAALSGGGERTGYTTIVILILFFGGVLITLVGVVGEYVARIYQELKMRPIFIEKESSLRKRER